MKIFCLRSTQYERFPEFTATQIVHTFPRGARTSQETDELVARIADEAPDFFYFYKDEQLTVPILSRIRGACPRTKFVMFYGDQRGIVPTLIQGRANLLDLLLINNEDPAQFRGYIHAGVHNVATFHHGVPENEFRDFPCEVTHNVFFGGNNFNHSKFPLSKFRYDLITSVRKEFKSLIVYGNGWPFKTRKSVPRPMYAHALRTAHINLGVNHYSILRYYDRRLFECVASGKLHITHYVPGMEHHFENHRHLVWFKSITEGLRMIGYYLKYPEKRTIVENYGKEYVRKHHNFQVRAKEFIRILEDL